MPRPDLNDVLIFTRVVLDGSFTAAAQSLGMPKSTVSRRVSELERALGARLLQRSTRRLQLTEVGAEYFEQARRMVDGLEDARRRIEARQAEPSGLLRVTAPADLATFGLAEIVLEYTERYPKTQVSLLLTQEYVNLVAEGVDVALRAASRLRDSSLVAKRFRVSRACLYASPDYLERRGTPRALADLVHHDCLLLGGELSRTWTFLCSGKEVSVPVSGRIAANAPTLLAAAAVAGGGVALLPELHARDAVARGELVAVLPDHELRQGSFHVVYPSRRHLPTKVRAFAQLVIDRFGSKAGARARGV